MECSRQKNSDRCPPLVFAILACLPAAAADNGGSFQQEFGWRDNFTTRLEALALLQSLNADLLSHDSATLTLDRWCKTHRLAAPAEIVADRVPSVDKAPTDEQRQILRVTKSEPVHYRRV